MWCLLLALSLPSAWAANAREATDPAPVRQERTAPKVSGGFGLLLGVSGQVRLDWGHDVVDHVDVRLAMLPGFAFGDVGGRLGGLQPVVAAGPEVALFPRSVVKLGLGTLLGASPRGIMWAEPGLVATAGLAVLIDPEGPFEMRLGLQAGVVGRARMARDTPATPAFGVVPDLSLGACW